MLVKEQFGKLEMFTVNKNFFKHTLKSTFKDAFIAAATLLFSLFATLTANAADADNPIATGAAEKTAPTIITKEPQEITVEINPTTTVVAPMAYHIPYLQSIIDIKADGSAIVTENFFLVVPEGSKDQPFSRKTQKIIKTPFGDRRINATVTKVMHNGSLTPFKIIPESDINLLKISSADKGLEPGVHSFSVQYYIHSAIKTIGDNDTFFWAVLAPSWNTPITRTALMIKHPNNIEPMGQTIFLNNKPDTKVKNVSHTGSSYNFVRNNMLYPSQTLVFIETFPKGSFANLAKGKAFKKLFDMDISTFSYLLGLLFIFSYYLALWFTAAKEKRIISDPSQNADESGFFSPAGFRTFLKKSFDAKTLLALILNLAQKGLLKIEENEAGTFTLIRQAKAGKETNLSKGERSFFSHLFTKGNLSVDLDGNTGSRLTKYRRNFEVPFSLEYDRQFLKVNYSYFLFGIGITVFSIIFSAALSGNPLWTGTVSASLALAVLLTVSSVFVLANTVRKPAHQGKTAKMLILLLLFASFSVLSVFYAYSMAISLNALATVFLGLMTFFLSLAYHLMKSEDKLGKAVRDKSDMYIDYLRLKSPLPEAYKSDPKKGIEAFLRSLPFAIASDNEAAYIERFAPLLNSAGEQIPWRQTKEKASALGIADFLSRLEKQITASVAFLNPKIQRFR